MQWMCWWLWACGAGFAGARAFFSRFVSLGCRFIGVAPNLLQEPKIRLRLGNFDAPRRTKSHVQLLPAGVPRSLRHLPRRIAGVFEGAPVLFLGVVLGIALVFRLGIGLLRPEPTAEPAAFASVPSTRSAVAAPVIAASAEARPKAHIVDPPPVASGRQRSEPLPVRKKARGPFKAWGPS